MPWRSWAVFGVVWAAAIAVMALKGKLLLDFYGMRCCFGCPFAVSVDLSASDSIIGFLASSLLLVAWHRKNRSMRLMQEGELA